MTKRIRKTKNLTERHENLGGGVSAGGRGVVLQNYNNPHITTKKKKQECGHHTQKSNRAETYNNTHTRK